MADRALAARTPFSWVDGTPGPDLAPRPFAYHTDG